MQNQATPPPSPWRRNLAVLGTLCLLSFALHSSALQGYWRWDDGLHLFNVSMYSPWSVFFDPQVTRVASGNQVAPWNLFMYQVNHALFGLDPFPYYLHHLLSLAGAAGGLYLLLRHWLGRWQALLPAALLLLGAPSAHMAQQLMVGHYLDGLLFACLGLWAYVHAVQRAQWRWALLAAAFYLLSALCKEIYVPWVALTLLLPLPGRSPPGAAGAPAVSGPPPVSGPPSAWDPSWNMARWRFALPTLAVAGAYAVLRIGVFSGMGGYHGSALGSWPDLPAFAAKLVHLLVSGLVGDGVLGITAALLCLACLAAGLAAQPARGRLAMLVGVGAVAVVVVFPLLFVVQPGVDPVGHTRYLWAPWVALCALWSLKWPAALGRWHAAAWLVFAAAVGMQSLAQREEDRAANTMFDTHYAFALNPPPGQLLVPYELVSATSTSIQIMYAYAALKRLEPGKTHPEPALVRREPADAAERARVRVWDEGCLCLVPLDSRPTDEQESILQAHLANATHAFPIDAPPPRVAHGYGGSIDSITVEGRHMRVKGWTPTLGTGRKMVMGVASPDIKVRLESLVSTERPDVVQALQQPGLLMSGFEATLEFADEKMAQTASKMRCAVVLGHLAGQQHQYLLLPVKGHQECDDALIPEATRKESQAG
jgi:hypothetical protein